MGIDLCLQVQLWPVHGLIQTITQCNNVNSWAWLWLGQVVSVTVQATHNHGTQKTFDFPCSASRAWAASQIRGIPAFSIKYNDGSPIYLLQLVVIVVCRVNKGTCITACNHNLVTLHNCCIVIILSDQQSFYMWHQKVCQKLCVW